MSDKEAVSSRAVFIDPADCDSIVAYKIVNPESPWGQVTITDCSRKIDWQFHEDTDPDKIAKAIQILEEFQFNLTKARNTKVAKEYAIKLAAERTARANRRA